MKKRLFAWLLALCMAFSAMPSQVFAAASATEFTDSGGEETVTDVSSSGSGKAVTDVSSSGSGKAVADVSASGNEETVADVSASGSGKTVTGVTGSADGDTITDVATDGGAAACAHENTATAYASVGDCKHTRTVTCSDCSETVSTETEACTDGDNDGICDLCKAEMSVAVPNRKADYAEATTAKVKTGMAYLLSDLQSGKIFEPVEGQSLNYTNYYYERSADGGVTFGEKMGFSDAIFGGTTIQLTENTAGTYVYRFYASHDGKHFSTDTWTLTLQVEDNPTMDFSFYVGKDYNGNYPIIKLYNVTTDSEGQEILGDEIENPFLYSNFTNTAPDGEEEYDVSQGKLVDNYQMFYVSLPAGRYAYRAFAKDTATGAYDLALGGMTLDLPTDTNVDGGAGGGTSVYLMCSSFYASSKKTDGTYFTAEEYHVEVACPLMNTSCTMGDPYVSGNYTYYPTMLYAAGNACLYNIYAYPDIAGYIFTQSINQTFRASYSAAKKALTINTEIKVTVTVPQAYDFGLYFQWNNFNTTEVAPSGDEGTSNEDRWTVNDDGTKTATYAISKGNGNYTWRLSDPTGTYVTKSGWIASQSASVSMEFGFTEDDLTDKTSHDRSRLGTMVTNRDEADLQLNLDPSGYEAITDTTRVRAYRHWQLISSDTANIMIEPDYHWNIAAGDATLSAVNGGNAVGNWADITPGTEDSIITVYYDSIDASTAGVKDGATTFTSGTHGGVFPATSPNRVGVLVVGGTGVTHGTADADVDYNMADGVATTRSEDWDYNYDTWYYGADETDPELDFAVKASGDVTVAYAFVSANSDLTTAITDFSTVTAGEDGRYAVPLKRFASLGDGKGGTVILKMTDSTGVSYRLVRVARVTVTTENVSNPGEEIMPGDQVKLTFDGMYRAVNKISGVFNPTIFKPTYYIGEDKFEGTLGQYQRMDNASVTVTIPEDLTFAEDAETADCTLTQGYTYGSMYSAANPFAFLYSMTDTGVGTNFNAVMVTYYLNHYADVTIEVARKVTYDVQLRAKDEDGTVIDGVTVSIKDKDGNAVEANENGSFTLGYGTYSYILAKDGYVATRGSFSLGSADADKVVDGILSIETAVMAKAGENGWDGTTATEPAKEEDGTYLIGTGAELAWFVQNGSKANAKLTADIELTGHDWTPLNKFYGTFDGQGHIISNLYINSSSYPVGLFGYVKTGATVKNLGITGDVTCTNKSNAQAGGIAGYLEAKASIEGCFSTVNVSTAGHGGGIAGYTDSGSVISNCYATGKITTTSTGTCYLGGICGSYYNCFAGATLTNCYSTATVIGSGGSGSYVGGLSPVATDSYYTNCYYLEGSVSKESSLASVGISGKGTAQAADELKALASTLGDSFREDSSNVNEGYPVLAWQVPGLLGDINEDGEITNADAAMAYAVYNGTLELTQAQITLADVNGDGEVTNVDAAMIYAFYSGTLEAFPADK